MEESIPHEPHRKTVITSVGCIQTNGNPRTLVVTILSITLGNTTQAHTQTSVLQCSNSQAVVQEPKVKTVLTKYLRH